ncbi:MAG: helix-turn-helix transcriptional regulator [Humidesulfovibrio sp.]
MGKIDALIESIPADQMDAALHGVLLELLAPAARLEELRRKELLTGQEVEALYGLDAGTLENWRRAGVGPVSTKVGKRVYYRHAALQDFILARQQRTYEHQQA